MFLLIFFGFFGNWKVLEKHMGAMNKLKRVTLLCYGNQCTISAPSFFPRGMLACVSLESELALLYDMYLVRVQGYIGKVLRRETFWMAQETFRVGFIIPHLSALAETSSCFRIRGKLLVLCSCFLFGLTTSIGRSQFRMGPCLAVLTL